MSLFLSELLIDTLYGSQPEVLPILAILGTLVDPPATMLNSTGDTVSSMIVTRWLKGREWVQNKTV